MKFSIAHRPSCCWTAIAWSRRSAYRMVGAAIDPDVGADVTTTCDDLIRDQRSL